MFTSGKRRVFVLLAGIGMGLLPAVVQPATAVAAGGTLYAIGASTPGEAVVSIDLVSGAASQLTDLTVPGAIDAQSSDLSADPAGHRLFLIRTVVTGFDPTYGFPIFEFQVVTVNALTGAIVSKPAFSGMAAQSLKFDSASGSLFGLTQTQVVKVDAASAAITPFANIPNPYGVYIYSTAVDSASHTLYIAQEDVSGSVETSSTRIFTVDTSSPGSISTGVVTDHAIRQIGVDGSLLYGITECCPANLVSIDKTTGVTTFLAAVGDSNTFVQFGTAADPATDTVFVNINPRDPITGQSISELLEVNLSNPGASATVPLPSGSVGMVFVPPAPVITAQSIVNDVKSALATGAIKNSGLAQALIAQLNAAAGARSRGQCSTAANDYRAFIHTVKAQSGKLIAASTASQLIGEAQFLIANCP